MSGPVIVTGASGFIGRNLTTALAMQGNTVWPVARRPLPGEGGGVAHRVEDYGDTPATSGATLVHLAETSDVAAAETAGEDHIRANLDRLDALLGKGYPRVVYISSALGRGVYGRAKAACEKRVLAAGGAVVRLTSVYGPGMSKATVLSNILAQVPGSDALRIRDGGAERDFLWIGDAAEGLARIALGRAVGRFDLGTGRPVQIGDLARLVLELAGELRRPVVETMAPGTLSERLIIDPGPVEQAFGWHARTALRDGLARLMSGNT